MTIFTFHSNSGRNRNRRKIRRGYGAKLLGFLLCLTILSSSVPLITAANQGEAFDGIAGVKEKETETEYLPEPEGEGEDVPKAEDKLEETQDAPGTEDAPKETEDAPGTEDEPEETQDVSEPEDKSEETEDVSEPEDKSEETQDASEPEDKPEETEDVAVTGKKLGKEKLYRTTDLAEGDDEGKKLADIVEFKSITLQYADGSGKPTGEAIENNALIEKDRPLCLHYKYEIPESGIREIKAETKYFLEVSPHLVLSSLESGSPLKIGEQQFGKIFSADGKAWVTFDKKKDSDDTVLSDYDELTDGYFYLDCLRADAPPENEPTINGEDNLYALKFENGKELLFGYAENQLVEARAIIKKEGSLRDKNITWVIDYTPWQNPGENDEVAMDTPFELRDIIDSDFHKYVDGSIKIDGGLVSVYDSRSEVPEGAESYAILEKAENGKDTVLIIGGTKFNAVAATKGNPAKKMEVTYETELNDKLFLPGGKDGQKVINEAAVFAGTDVDFRELNISSAKTVTISQPTWLKKEGKTTRHTDGTGSTTDWTITFLPNGFNFTEENQLTLYDQLPNGSTLVGETAKVNGEEKKINVGKDGGFTISPIKTDKQPVTIVYQTSVPEEMYNSGTDLGDNKAWFTFLYRNEEYATPEVTASVGSGNGTGTSGTATLEKSNSGYNSSDRTITWTVTINPHKAYLKEGTFTDDLRAAFESCNKAGHNAGLELKGAVSDITVLIDGKEPEESEKKLVKLGYSNQTLTVTVGEVGAKTITLIYTTRVCDPCIFANNTVKKLFVNTISTENMIIGKQSTEERKASASSTSVVDAAVLHKKAPVYDYGSQTMKWTVEVNEAKLPMTDVVLRDNLPAGLTFIDGSLDTMPKIANTEAQFSGQELTIKLGDFHEKVIVSFDTKVEPEMIGFSSNDAVEVSNIISMAGKADNMEFMEVSHEVAHSFTNHGLVKSSKVDNEKEWIQYEVLINPYGLALPENPSLVDTLDKRLQLDMDTLQFYEAELSGTTDVSNRKPDYKKKGDGHPLEVSDYNPVTNSFTVQLPIKKENNRGAYVLTYTADIIQKEQGGYGNSVRFDGGCALLGGSKNNSATVGGGGGGGGGGVATRKAGITITKRDSQNQEALKGVTFTLYQWDAEKNKQGLPIAQGTTDDGGKLSFKVKPRATYELVETGSLSGYGSELGWETLPSGVRKSEKGLLITAGEEKSELTLNLTNEADTTDIVFLLFNQSGIPMAGQKVKLFFTNPDDETNPIPDREAVVSENGTVRFSGLRRGAAYFLRQPGGETMIIDVPFDVNESPKATLPDGTQILLASDYRFFGAMDPGQQWSLTVLKTTDGKPAPLAGATFGLYTEKDCRTLIKTDISGRDGIVTFQGLIKGQKYWLREVAAPAGYNQDFTVYEVDESANVLTIPNTLKTSSWKPQGPDNSGDSGNAGSPGSSGNFGNSTDFEELGNFGVFKDAGGREDLVNQDTSLRIDLKNSVGIIQNTKPAVYSNGHDRQSAGEQTIPQTGDNTPGLIAVVSLSGILLALMTLSRFLREKNDEKN